MGAAGIAVFAAVCVWILGAAWTPLPPGGDRRLSEAAKRLGVSTEEAAMRAIDAGPPHLNPDGD